jgi:hypothetical protein
LVAVDRPEVMALIQAPLDLQRRLVAVVAQTVITALAHLGVRVAVLTKILPVVAQELPVKEMPEVLRQGRNLETLPVAVAVQAQ